MVTSTHCPSCLLRWLFRHSPVVSGWVCLSVFLLVVSGSPVLFLPVGWSMMSASTMSSSAWMGSLSAWMVSGSAASTMSVSLLVGSSSLVWVVVSAWLLVWVVVLWVVGAVVRLMMGPVRWKRRGWLLVSWM